MEIMLESDDEDHVVSTSKRMKMEGRIEVPNVPISNKRHWNLFNSSRCIKKSLQSDGSVQVCDVCKLEFSPLYPGHKYSYMGVNYMHDTCFYTHLALCKCLVCVKMIIFVNNTMTAQKVSDNFDKALMTVEDDEQERLLEEKLDAYWYKFHNDSTNFLADMIVAACKKNNKVASDSTVPDVDSPSKIPDPVFESRNCVNTSVLRKLFTSCAKIFSDSVIAYNLAKINNVPNDQLPMEPTPCIVLSALPYYDVHVCVEKISIKMHGM